MKFGICTDAKGAALAAQQGWDYVEANAQALFQGDMADADFVPQGLPGQWPLPIYAANCLLPGAMKIVGRDVDTERVFRYISRVIARATATEVRTLAFGSGVARRVPEGISHAMASRQIQSFLRMAGELASAAGIKIAIEPLNPSECNILNTVAETMDYVRAVNLPSIRCLVDSYHFWLVDEPMDHLASSMASIAHVHLADKVRRTAPGESGESDYLPLFRVLKAGNYQGLISVEAGSFDLAEAGSRVLGFLRETWDKA